MSGAGECIIESDDFSPGAIADSGQCFRMRPLGEDAFSVTAMGRELTVRTLRPGVFSFSCDKDEFDRIWRDYFDLDRDYEEYRRLVLPDDSFLRDAIDLGRGIRILRQEPFETLISFIISQRKSVPVIRKSVERLSDALGAELPLGSHAFPEPIALAHADEEILKAAGLGYRVPYVRHAAKETESGELNLESLRELPSDELIARLMLLPGVGLKVASCVALFAYHRIDIVPVDVWMNRVLDVVYGGALPSEYRECQGVLHQYMFNYARICRIGT